jgi:hypothetical protein
MSAAMTLAAGCRNPAAIAAIAAGWLPQIAASLPLNRRLPQLRQLPLIAATQFHDNCRSAATCRKLLRQNDCDVYV